MNNKAELQVGKVRRKGHILHMVVKFLSGVRHMSKDEVGGV